MLNVKRSGRTHCRFTGPYYLAMIAPALMLGVADAPLYAWLVLAALVLLGDKIVWWAMSGPRERSLIQTTHQPIAATG